MLVPFSQHPKKNQIKRHKELKKQKDNKTKSTRRFKPSMDFFHCLYPSLGDLIQFSTLHTVFRFMSPSLIYFVQITPLNFRHILNQLLILFPWLSNRLLMLKTRLLRVSPKSVSLTVLVLSSQKLRPKSRESPLSFLFLHTPISSVSKSYWFYQNISRIWPILSNPTGTTHLSPES